MRALLLLGLVAITACGAPARTEAARGNDDYYLGVLRLAGDAGAVPSMPVYSARVRVPDLAPLLDQVSRALGYDYVALGVEGLSLREDGWRCARAPDRVQCQAAFAAIRPPPEAWRERYDEHPLAPRRCFLLTERAGAFQLASTPESVKRALGAVDSVAMAGLFAWLDGYDPWSPGPEEIVPTGQQDGSGWRITARTRHFHEGQPMACAWNMHVLYISRMGALHEVRTVPVLKSQDCGSGDQLRK